MAVVAFAVFLYGDLLISRNHTIVSHENTDTCCQFVSWRTFGFGELAKGNLPLWLPNVFSGSPFVGNIQAAMFYPVLAPLYLALPLAKAINAEVFLHTLLIGLSMLAWVRNRGSGWMGAVLASAVAMAAAPYCYRVNLGQLNVIAVHAWLPLTLLAIDKLFERISLGWFLAGALAVSMQLLAGYPPAVFNNAFAIALYCGLCLLRHPTRVRTSAALLAMALVPLFIGAAPLAAGYHTTRESLRADGTSIDFATSWSLPPENFFTAFAPLFFGDYRTVTYWGRWCLWDVSVYIGTASLFVMLYGAVFAPRAARRYSGTVLLLLVLTALGRYTPFFSLLYHWVPGFSSFRAPSKFLLPALVFAAMLAGLGADELLRRPRSPRVFALAALTCGACLLAAGLALHYVPSLVSMPNGFWPLLMDGMEQTKETYPWAPITETSKLDAAWIAGVSALMGAVVCIVTAFLFMRSGQGTRYRAGLIALCIVEVLCFSRLTRETVNLDVMSNADLIALRKSAPGDYRVLQAKSFNPNWRRSYPIDIGMLAPWGYDPVMLDRYARAYCFALGGKEKQDYLVNEGAITNIFDPLSKSLAESIFAFSFEKTEGGERGGAYPYVTLPRVFQVMRCKYVYFWPEDRADSVLGGVRGVYEARDPFPRFSIYRKYAVVQDPKQVLPRMVDPAVDLNETLFLEREPSPPPGPAADGGGDSVTLVEESTDDLTLDVNMASAGVLFITDAYSNGWRAKALPGSAQQQYEILPADYAFQGIALAAGRHRIHLEYAPAIVTIGIWITAISSLCYLLACGGWCWGALRPRAPA